MSLVLTLAPGNSQKVAVSGVSAQSTPITGSGCAFYCDTDCYIRQGSNPTAVADGTDQFVPAGAMIRLTGITPGNKLAIISANSVAGNAYITPGA